MLKNIQWILKWNTTCRSIKSSNPSPNMIGKPWYPTGKPIRSQARLCPENQIHWQNSKSPIWEPWNQDLTGYVHHQVQIESNTSMICFNLRASLGIGLGWISFNESFLFLSPELEPWSPILDTRDHPPGKSCVEYLDAKPWDEREVQRPQRWIYIWKS